MKTIYVVMTQPTAPAYLCFIKKPESTEKIAEQLVKFEDISNLIIDWAEKYETKRASLVGPFNLTQQVIHEVHEKEMVRYSQHRIVFDQERKRK